MKSLTTMMAALAGLAGDVLPMKMWKNELRSRNWRRPRAEIQVAGRGAPRGTRPRRNWRRPRAEIQARQRRWIARRSSIDGVWRYDGRVTEGGAQ